jgi:hypothetical protein
MDGHYLRDCAHCGRIVDISDAYESTTCACCTDWSCHDCAKRPATNGDARCNYCDGPMPCYCPRPAGMRSEEEEAEQDLEDRNSYEP